MSASDPSTARWAKIATLWSVVTAFTLVVTKAIAWQQSGSVAILGSFADSLLDFVSSGIAFIGVRMAAMPPDENHRFGHGKAEAVSSLVQLVLITGAAVFVLVESVRSLMSPEPIEHSQMAVSVMLVSIFLTTILVAVQTYAIRRSGSLATESDRAHFIGDFLGNSGTLLAVILAANFGLLWVDGVAGIMAAGFLFWSVWQIGKRALPQLMDEELDEEARRRIEHLVLTDPLIHRVHALRTRKAGRTAYIQLHVELDGGLTLYRAHQIADAAERRLRKAYPGADVIIHQDIFGQFERHDEFGHQPVA